MEKVGDCGAPREPRKRKCYISYSEKERAKIGQYASENSNSAALKIFRIDFPELEKSTIRSFKTKYISVLQEKRKHNDLTPVSSIPSNV